MANENMMIEINEAKASVMANYPNDPLLKHIITEALDKLPKVDAAPVVHGRWVGYHEADIGYDEYGVRCSNCNFEVEDHEVNFIMNYCPNCGAKMDGGGADDRT